MAAACGFALFGAFATPTFAGSDEAPHYSYAVELSNGRLPTINTPMPRGESPILRRWLQATHVTTGPRSTVWVANHPPLFYAIAAPAVKVADAFGGESSGPQSMRVLSALFLGFGVGAIGLLAHEAFRGRSVPVVAAASMAAALPYVAGTGAVVYNDAFAFFLTATAFAVAARIVRRGPSWPRVAGASLVGSAAALTRAELLVLVPLLIVAFGVSNLALPNRESRRVLLRQAATIAVVPVIASAWFYVRNYDLYGSWSASGYLLDRFGRAPHLGSTLDVLRSDELLGRVTAHLFTSTPVMVGTLRANGILDGSWYAGNWRDGFPVAALVLVPALLGALRAGVRQIRMRESRTPDEQRWLGFVVLLVGYSVVVTVAVAHSVVEGHNIWARYFLPLVPVLVIATIWGLDRLWSSRWLLGAVVTVMFLVEIEVTFYLAPSHFFYPFVGMGASGESALGQNVGRAIAIVGVVVALAAIAWPTAKPRLIDLTSGELEGPAREAGDAGLEEREHGVVAGTRGEPGV